MVKQLLSIVVIMGFTASLDAVTSPGSRATLVQAAIKLDAWDAAASQYVQLPQGKAAQRSIDNAVNKLPADKQQAFREAVDAAKKEYQVSDAVKNAVQALNSNAADRKVKAQEAFKAIEALMYGDSANITVNTPGGLYKNIADLS